MISKTCNALPRALGVSLALALALALPGRALGQTPPPAGPVVSVRIEPALHDENPWTLLGLREGESYSPGRVREALRVALSSGTFADAQASVRAVPGGVEVVIRGGRRYAVRSVSVVGAQARSRDEVATDLGIREGEHITDGQLADAVERVRQGYVAIGWLDATARATWRETDRPGSRVMVLRVDEGEPTTVTRVTLEGVPEDLADAVRDALGLAPGDVADPRLLRRASERVRRELRQADRLGAAVRALEFVPAGPRRAELRLSVRAGPRYRIAWEGAHSASEGELVAALRLDEERELDVTTVAALAARVRNFYVRRAWLDAEVEGGIEPEGVSGAVLRFRVREGPRVFVRSLSFPGARQLGAEALAEAVRALSREQLPSSGLTARVGSVRLHVTAATPRPDDDAPLLVPAETYVPEVYAEAARRIVQRYRELGYLDASVSAPRVTRGVDARGGPVLDVTFTVTEGARTFFEECVFEGSREVASADLASAAGLQLGAPLSYDRLEEARVRLTDYYRERAYAFARVETEVERSPDRTRARARFVIHEGPRVRVGALRIVGNEHTRDSVIRSRLALSPGGWYVLSSVRTSQQRLGALGVFTGVTIALDAPEAEAPVKDVVVRVAERRAQSMEFRVGYSTAQGARAAFEYNYWHAFGVAMSIGLRAEVGYFIPIPGITPTFFAGAEPSTVERFQYRINPGLGFPHVPLLGPSFAAALDGNFVRTLNQYFLLRTEGVSPSLRWRPSSGVAFTFAGEVQHATVTLFGSNCSGVNGPQCIENFLRSTLDGCLASGTNPETCYNQARSRQQSLRFPDLSSDLGAVRASVTLDSRDNAFNPTRGALALFTAEYLQNLSIPSEGAPPINTLHFEGRVTGYVPLFAGIVWATSLRAGWNFQVSDRSVTHPSRLFLLGGADSMRGWLQNSLVPQDIADKIQNQPAGTDNAYLALAIGGDLYVNVRTELRVPTPLCLSGLCLSLGIFLDAGNLWQVPPALGDLAAQLVNLRLSPGAGLRLGTPIGPLAVDFGFNPWLREYLGEQVWAFQFSIGLF